MTLQEQNNDLFATLTTIQGMASYSKNDIVEQYGTFDKFLSKLNQVIDSGLLLKEYTIVESPKLQPIYINGPCEIHVSQFGQPQG